MSLIARMDFSFVCLLLLTLCLFSCDREEPKPEPTLADFISGRWEAVSAVYGGVERPEWIGLTLTVEKETDTSGVFYAENLPSYEEVPVEVLDLYWQKTSSWVLGEGKNGRMHLVRSDGVEMGVDTISENAILLSFFIPIEIECDVEEEEGCPLGFEEDWNFKMERL